MDGRIESRRFVLGQFEFALLCAKNGPNATVVFTAVAALLEMSVELFNGLQNFRTARRFDVCGFSRLVRPVSGILDVEMSTVGESLSSSHLTNKSVLDGMALGV
jgi:hypothetical protein